MMRLRRHLASDTRGAAVIEFAIVAPVLCLVLMGLFEVGHTLYMRAAVQGALQKVARDSTLETNTLAEQTALLDNRIRESALALNSAARVDIKRRFYRTFSEAAAAKAEDWTDTNRNGRCDAGEPYEDANLNGVWDSDGGNDGQGGAKDATVVTVTVSYAPMFPLLRLLNQTPKDTRIVATTVLKNQPYADQSSYGRSVRRNCT